MEKGQKVWLVKYALTGGITEEVVRSTNGDFAYMESRSWGWQKIGRDVFADHAEAIKAAEALRQEKLASLRKQCTKLEKLKF